mmetsp:Transcript_15776/g.40203  ORF Transcript_15776/g.40203 Transcript_15776/m.40203 type:complete len:180 (-) Transcript_15776:195-734(-)
MCPNGDGDAQSHSSTTIRRKAKPAHSRLNILEQVLTLKGRLDTSNGKWQGDIKLRKKFFADSKFPLFTRADVGASYSTKSDEVLYGLKAKKCIELSPDGLLSLDVKGGYQMAAALPTTKKVWDCRVELSQKVFNFTEDQDVKVKLGYDVATRKPYGQIRENNWTLNTDFRKKFSLNYDL